MMTQLNKTISPIRQRMIGDMNMRKFNTKNQVGYIGAVAKRAKYLKNSLAQTTSEELRQFQIVLAVQGIPNVTINATLRELQLLYNKILNRPDVRGKSAICLCLESFPRY
jgi:integrase/recombinase XerD